MLLILLLCLRRVIWGNWREFRADDDKIITITPVLWQLTNLQVLSLAKNPTMRYLPPEIGAPEHDCYWRSKLYCIICMCFYSQTRECSAASQSFSWRLIQTPLPGSPRNAIQRSRAGEWRKALRPNETKIRGARNAKAPPSAVARPHSTSTTPRRI